MSKSKISEIRSLEPKAILAEKIKVQAELVNAKAALAQAGRKNSKETIKLRKQIAVLQTIFNEKILSEGIKG